VSSFVYVTVQFNWTDIADGWTDAEVEHAAHFGHNRRVHNEGRAMADSTVWWLMAGAAVAVELATGTFYLLMLAIGLVAGALAAHAGAATPTQLVVAAIIGGGAVTALHLHKRRRPAGAPAQGNPDVNPDIGETVQIDAWQPDGTASVRYRGANWTVVAAPGTAHDLGAHRVREVVGNRLIVEKT
jgi:membrane protein implicated in regulation of membrane protease activity